MKVFIVISLLLVSISLCENSTEPGFDYYMKGRDWTEGTCKGKEQSPISIKSSQAPCSPYSKLDVILNDFPIDTIPTDNGHTILVNGEFSELLAFFPNGKVIPFVALQFHFHAPGEHIINGNRYPLEMHMVYQVPDSYPEAKTLKRNYAALGFPFEVDDQAPPHPLLEALELDDLGQEVSINLYELLKIDPFPKYYGYDGSVTTPPCNETVNWFVLQDVQKMTSEQLELFHKRWAGNEEFAGGNGNNRMVEPLNGRKVFQGNC